MEGSDFIMAIVITNGKFYVKCSDNGGIRKTPDITKNSFTAKLSPGSEIPK